MAGVVAALKTHDDIGLLRQPVDDLALSLITPLGADDDNIPHSQLFPLQLSWFRHDLFEKPVSTLWITVQGHTGARAHARHTSDKGSGWSRQARRHSGQLRSPNQPIDIPRKYAPHRASGAPIAGIFRHCGRSRPDNPPSLPPAAARPARASPAGPPPG